MVWKSAEELLSEYLIYPIDEFLPLWRQDAIGAVFGIEQAAKVLNLMLDDDQFDREQARKILNIIQNSTNGLGSIIDASIEYHKRQNSISDDNTTTG